MVSEVANLSEDDIESATNITDDRNLDYIIGVTKKEGGLITLLNVEKLIGELLEK